MIVSVIFAAYRPVQLIQDFFFKLMGCGLYTGVLHSVKFTVIMLPSVSSFDGT